MNTVAPLQIPLTAPTTLREQVPIALHLDRRGSPRLKLTAAVAFFPMACFQAYLLMTVLLFAFGPWDWPITNPLRLYGFLAVSQCALGLGYYVAVRKRRLAITIQEPGRKLEIALWIAAATMLVMFLPTLSVRTGGNIDLLRGITDPGAAYRATREAVAQASSNGYVEYARMCLSPIIWCTFPLTVVFWSSLSKPLRIFASLAVISEPLIYLVIGTNKGLADVLLLMPWLLLIRSRDPSRLLRPRRVVAVAACFLLGAGLFLPYFERGMTGRDNTTHRNEMYMGNGVSLSPDQDATLDSDWFLTNNGWASITSYVTQGYYGLSLSLQEPFVWTYGVGNSRVLQWLVEKTLLDDKDAIWNRTYVSRVASDYGWDRYVRWHSIYPWLASDVSFWGVPPLVFIIGYFFGLSWLDSLAKNPFAVVVFGLFAIMLYYFSANNQVGQASDTVFAFWVSFAVWLRSRNRGRAQAPFPLHAPRPLSNV